MNLCEGLNALSVRCGQPGQQQGRRIPSFSSERTRATCSLLFSGVLTDSAQQIHSLRARGVMSCHTESALGSDANALRKSGGSLCTVPWEICLVMRFLNDEAGDML